MAKNAIDKCTIYECVRAYVAIKLKPSENYTQRTHPISYMQLRSRKEISPILFYRAIHTAFTV